MPRQLDTLFFLNSVLEDLEMAEEMIQAARQGYPLNQRVQLELDREQADVDHKRARVLAIQYNIASSN